MFEHDLHSGFTRRASFHWFLLAFLAGSVNAGSFLSCQRFVTHTTGFATLIGVSLAQGDVTAALEVLAVPLFFIMGTMIAAWLTVRRRYRGQVPDYRTAMAIVALLLLAAAAGGSFDLFGVFGEAFYPEHTYVLLSLLCMASGLLNAAITTSSGHSVRVTHLTGITTDLGIGLVESFCYRGDPAQLARSRGRNWVRVGTIASFIGGGLAGGVMFLRLHYLGFLMPAAIACYAMVIARRYRGKQAPPDPVRQPGTV